MTVEITFSLATDSSDIEERRLGSLMARFGAALQGAAHTDKRAETHAENVSELDASTLPAPVRRARSSKKGDPVEQYQAAGGAMPEPSTAAETATTNGTYEPESVSDAADVKKYEADDVAAAPTVETPTVETPTVETPSAETPSAETLSDEAMDELRAKVRDLAQNPAVGALKLRPHFQKHNVTKVKDLPVGALREMIADFTAVIAAVPESVA